MESEGSSITTRSMFQEALVRTTIAYSDSRAKRAQDLLHPELMHSVNMFLDTQLIAIGSCPSRARARVSSSGRTDYLTRKRNRAMIFGRMEKSSLVRQGIIQAYSGKVVKLSKETDSAWSRGSSKDA